MTTLPQRHQLLALIDAAVTAGAREARACAVVGLTARTLQRWRHTPAQGDRRPERVQASANQLSDAERERLLAVANSEAYGHLPPSQIVPRLADTGVYLASEATFYRVLRAAGQLTQRTPERRRQPVARPQPLQATAPRQLFSWDITYLPAATRGRYYYLYLFLDLFSRHIVGWQVYDTEDSERAAQLLRDLCRREGIAPGQVVLHSDNGGPMKGATMLATLQELGVAPSFSRPAVSDDNPYSESLFRTLKYRPQYPRVPFANLQAARDWVAEFVTWYGTEHRHSAIGFVTPAQRHAGTDRALLAQRHQLYQTARAAHPERWSGATRNWQRVDVVHLNPPRAGTARTRPATHLERAA